MIDIYFGNHNHSCYSSALLGFPDAITRVNELIQYAYDQGLSGISITEHEGISSHMQALKYYEKMEMDRPFKLALGNEIYLMSEEEDKANREGTEYTPYYHFVLTALDTEGHKQLREISSRAWQHAYTSRRLMRRPTYYTDIEEVINGNTGHLIASSACLGSYLDKLILTWKKQEPGYKTVQERIDGFMTWCGKVFGFTNFYLEIQPCKADNTDQFIVNETMKELSQQYGFKIIATTDTHYLNKESALYHKTLLNSKEGDREVDSFYATTYLMSPKELREYLQITFTDKEIDEIFKNSNEIADRVGTYDLKHMPMIPEIPLDKLPEFKITHRYRKYYNKYEYFKYYAYSDNIQDQYFFYRIEKGLEKLIESKPQKNLETYIDRINKEAKELKGLSEIFKSHMAAYYTSVSRIVEIIWESNSFCMPSRGSAFGYLTCYLLEITQIDPVPLGDYAPYWRHLSTERGIEIPD